MAQEGDPNSLLDPIRARLQGFAVVAPREKMVLEGGIGSIRRILFNRSETAKQLVRLLAVPVYPQDSSEVESTAQTTASDPAQGTQMDKSVKRDDDGKIGTGGGRAEAPVDFNSIPVEMNMSIAREIPDVADIVCLGLTDRWNWNVCQEAMHDHYMGLLGRWAGKSIVFVGEEVEVGDYPPQLKDMAHPKTDEGLYELALDGASTVGHVDLEVLSSDTIDRVKARIEAYKKDEKSKASGFEDPAFQLKLPGLSVTERTYFPGDKWVLRCTTLKEFVRPEPIALKPEFIQGPEIEVLGLGEVALMYTFYSPRKNGVGSVSNRLAEGRWAGCCLDIVPLARHEAETRDDSGESEWKDVSDEASAMVAEIFQMFYGPWWRETLCNPHAEPNIWIDNDPVDDLRYPAEIPGADP